MSNKVATFAIGDKVVFTGEIKSHLWMKQGVVTEIMYKGLTTPRILKVDFDKERHPFDEWCLYENVLSLLEPESIDDLL